VIGDRKKKLDYTGQQSAGELKRVTVYASSSGALDAHYYEAAARLGSVLGQAGLEIVYGGGGVGLMGAMADRALAEGAHVHGVIPHFLNTVEHGHAGLSRLDVVDDIRERKKQMLAGSDAVISLPGGSGTFEEVFEALTLKRLGVFLGPIVLINTHGYFNRFVDFLRYSIEQRFMSERHLDMWALVDEPEEVLAALRNATPWSADARKFAAVRR
jgi:hypothetical protein